MAILITGGTGYIGSHIAVLLLEKGYEVVLADNFSNSKRSVLERIEKISQKNVAFYECDMCDKIAVKRIFEEQSIEAAIHFAGLKAVGESVEFPLKYYDNNLTSALNLLEVMDQYGCKNIIFSSSATVYQDTLTALPSKIGSGIIEGEAISEDFPLATTNPYGTTKLMIEQILRDLYLSNPTWNVVILRYFNPVGAHPSYLIGEDPKGIPNNLVPYMIQVAKGIRPHLNIFGEDYPTKDGTGVRDYIHIMDLAEGHFKALERLKLNKGLDIYNLGTGTGYSVLEVLHTFERIIDQIIPYRFSERRPGDIASCYSNVEKAQRELQWEAKHTLEDMCASAWEWANNQGK